MIINSINLYTFCLIYLWLFNDLTTASLSKQPQFANGGKMFPPESFPPPTFDENAPICTFDKEPCGFYSFNTNGNMSFKWVKSWCRCDVDQKCAFDRIDMRMRVFRNSCVYSNKTFNASKTDKQKHRHARHHQIHYE